MRNLFVSSLRAIAGRAEALATALEPPCEEITLGGLAEAAEDQEERLDALEAEVERLRALAGRVSALEGKAAHCRAWAQAEEVLRPRDGVWPQHSAAELDRLQGQACEALRRLAEVPR